MDDSSPEHAVRVGWGPTSAIFLTFFLYFGAQFFAGVVLAILSAVTSLSFGLSDEGSPVGIAGQFYFVVISDAAMLLALWLFLRSRRSGFRSLGLARRPAIRDAGYVLAGYAVYFGLLVAALAILGPLTGINLEQQQELGFNNLFSGPEIVMGFIALVALPPIIEELVFRGFLFTGLRKRLTFIWATLITSFLFASPHLLASSEGLLWVAGVDTFVLSLVLCYAREKTGALWAPIAIHAIKNAIAFSILLSGAV